MKPKLNAMDATAFRQRFPMPNTFGSYKQLQNGFYLVDIEGKTVTVQPDSAFTAHVFKLGIEKRNRPKNEVNQQQIKVNPTRRLAP